MITFLSSAPGGCRPLSCVLTLAISGAWVGAAETPSGVPARAEVERRSETVELSPFVIDTSRDDSFAASNAGTATRLALNMAEVPAAYSVITRELIEALNITNAAEAASWAPNGAAASPQDLVQAPLLANNRGIGVSGQQRNNYLTGGLLESYAVEQYEFGRGPNAALFNIGASSALSGGMGAQTKRARYDRSFETIASTYGSWDYKRTTLDVNRALTNRLAVRGNAVWFDRGGWAMNEFERTKGATAGLSYLIRPQTEFRIEGARDSTRRNIVSRTAGIYDELSGWDGVTVFREPISNAILGTANTPGVPNSFGQVLRFQGESQGVTRRGSEYYVWSPYSGQPMVMNYQNEGYTRRADQTANVPMLSNGVLYTRGTGLPFGNGSTGTIYPTATQNLSNPNFLYQLNLPADRFDRAIAGSAFELPDKRFTQMFDVPGYTQDMKDVNFALAHQIGREWFIEVGADVNRVDSRTLREGGLTGVNNVRIDINQLLPNGAPNPNFLQPYGDAPLSRSDRNFINRSVRANLAYKLENTRWGSYMFNLNAARSSRTTENRTSRYSIANLPDPRMWQSVANTIVVRQYWNAPSRPYGDDGIPAQLSRNVFSADNNSYTTLNEAVRPRWVMANWDDTKEKFDNAVLAMSAKYWGGRLMLLAAQRYDRFSSRLRSRAEYGDLPSDWDGVTLYYKPEAPEDWESLTYIPRNLTTGVPTSTRPVPAATRPRQNQPGVVNNNGVQIYNPLFANDRFRNDYSPPVNEGSNFTGTYGGVFKAFKKVAVVGNYSTSYVPPPTNSFKLDNSLAAPRTGFGYDGGLRLTLLEGRLTTNVNYFFNREDNQSVAPPTTTSINNLLGRNSATDPSSEGRNIQGAPNIFGTDYQSSRTSGVEVEVIGQIARGMRFMLNFGTARVFTFDRFPQAREIVLANADLFRQVLEDAGGRLDTTQHPNGAPGLAVVNSAVVAAVASEQTGAVTDYNTIWTNYAAVLSDQPAISNDRWTLNVYLDYTMQTGRLKGLRLGLGAQVPGRDYAGSRSADTIVDPNNPTRTIDDPTVDQSTAVFVKRPTLVNATLGYGFRFRENSRWFKGKEMTFQLSIKNLLNDQSIVYAVFDVVARPPGGDLSKPNRVSVTPRNGVYTQPTSFLFTTTLKL